MSIPKLAGIETEYGILIRGATTSDPFFASGLVLRSYPLAASRLQAIETPQTPLPGENADATAGLVQWTNSAAAGDIAGQEKTAPPAGSEAADLAGAGSPGGFESLMLPNGARFYIDHGHPEYSTAEAATPRGVVAADKAGEIIVERCRRAANAGGRLGQGCRIAIYKNNSDQQGVSYGCHENYLLAADTFEGLLNRKFHRTLMALVPFLVTRPLLCGAGKACAENHRPSTVFQLTQRADFFETLIGPQTTFRRPLINTRDEPHADPRRFRRLHVIVGDANMAEYSTFLKVGTTQLVLMMLEDNYVDVNLMLEDPLAALQTVSRDLTFREKLPLACGREVTAMEIQQEFLRLAQKYLAERSGMEALEEVARVWEDALKKLEADWRLLGGRLDWAIKRRLLEHYLEDQGCDWETASRWAFPVKSTLKLDRRTEGKEAAALIEAIRTELPEEVAESLADYARREGLDWADYWRQRDIYFTLRRLDLEYHDIDRGSGSTPGGLFAQLQQAGAVERLLADAAIDALVDAPPPDTRAYLRGYCIAHYGQKIQHVDWAEIQFRGSNSAESGRLVLGDPTAGTAGELGPLPTDPPELPALVRSVECRRRASAGERVDGGVR